MAKKKVIVDTLQQKEFFESIQDILKTHSKQRKKSDKQRINQLKRMLSKTPIGNNTLNFIKDNKIKILIDNQTEQLGYYISRSQTVILGGNRDFYEQLSTLVHETRHAHHDKDNIATNSFGEDYDVKGYIFNQRLFEADCNAHQILNSIQLHYLGYDKPLKRELYNKRSIAIEMIKKSQKTKSSEKILMTGFNAWMLNKDMIKFYDDLILDQAISILSPQTKSKDTNSENQTKHKRSIISNFEYADLKNYNPYIIGTNKDNLAVVIEIIGNSFGEMNYTKKYTKEILNNPSCFSIFLNSSIKKVEYLNKLKKQHLSK